VVAEALTRHGLQVAAAADGAGALQKLDGAAFDLAIVDRSLPDMDGWELAGRIRRNHPKIRLILLNAPGRYPKPIDDIAVDGFLSKPVGDRDLVRAVIQALHGMPDGPPVSPAIQPPQARLRILVVEDNPVNQKVARLLLEKRGHMVEIANDGLEAVAAWERGSFDLILMDVQMPVMDGYEATEAIRRREAGSARRVSIIALTAHAMNGDEARCRAAGMDGYLAKPIEIKDLNALIERTELEAAALAGR